MKKIKINKSQFLAVMLLWIAFSACDDEETSVVVNPSASFTYTLSDEDFYEVKFVSKITDRDSLRWDFGDGETSVLSHPVHVYEELGEYTVTLTAYGESGSIPAEVLDVITIELIDPSVEITGSSVSDEDALQITFKSTSTYVKSLLWDFGDGSTSTEASPVHIYEEAGDYTVTLTGTGFEGTTNAVATKVVSAGIIKTQIEGTVIGHEGSWDGVNGLITAALDGDLNTFVDAADGSTGYVGYDFGEGNVALVNYVKYAPRSGYVDRLTGGEIRASNDADYLTTYDVLYTIESPGPAGELTEIEISTENSYRYVYYYGPENGYCNIAELEFYGTVSSN